MLNVPLNLPNPSHFRSQAKHNTLATLVVCFGTSSFLSAVLLEHLV